MAKGQKYHQADIALSILTLSTYSCQPQAACRCESKSTAGSFQASCRALVKETPRPNLSISPPARQSNISILTRSRDYFRRKGLKVDEKRNPFVSAFPRFKNGYSSIGSDVIAGWFLSGPTPCRPGCGGIVIWIWATLLS